MAKIEGVHTNWYDAARAGLRNATDEEALALKFSMFLTTMFGAVGGYILHGLGV